MSGEGLWRRLTRGTCRLKQRPDWARFVGPDWAERVMGAVVTDHFHAKQGRSTGRWVLRSSDGSLSVFLKRHYRLSWWRGLLAALWPEHGWSPALQEWRHLEWARAQGLPVPATVAAGEYIGPWTRLQSFLAVEELVGMLPLHEAIPAAATRLAPTDFQRWKRTLTAELARLARALHDRRCFHKDLYLCHFFIPQADTETIPRWRGRVHLIDLHRLAHHPWTWPVWLAKDLAQLLYSSEIAEVSPRDRLRFWRYYRIGTSRWAGRWLHRFILLKWRLYRRQRSRRRLLPAVRGNDGQRTTDNGHEHCLLS